MTEISSDFFSIEQHGFVRIACASPLVHLADPFANAQEILTLSQKADLAGADLVLFPEMSLTAYSLEDLFTQDTLIKAASSALNWLCQASQSVRPVMIVGLPVLIEGALYNCACVIHEGRVLGVVPKQYLPNYREFYEKRYFASGLDLKPTTIDLGSGAIRVSKDLLFRHKGVVDFTFGIEICEDMWSAHTPSTRLALNGAHIILNLSASPALVGKSRTRKRICAATSERLICAYGFSAAGFGESTTDLSWDGQTLVYEMGDLLAQGERFVRGTLSLADVDIGRIISERLRTPTFHDARLSLPELEVEPVRFNLSLRPRADLQRPIERFPYVPNDQVRLDEDCFEAFNLQMHGLMQRLTATKIKDVVIGVSGGLDSTHALIVAVKAFDRLGLPRSGIHAYSLPGFGTTTGSKSDALKLMKALGVEAKTIDIRAAAKRMLIDISHPFGQGEAVYDVNFENVQAGLRTDFLFRLAGEHKGFVIGTGDLSELALGWCTYGVGDHMSHYNVNCGAPKTLIQHLIRWAARSEFDARTARVLTSVLSRDISPELIPMGDNAVTQRTEDIVGPYELQDFNLYYLTRYGFMPSKIAFLAWHTWRDSGGVWPPHYPLEKQRSYTLTEIKFWLDVFLQRFFAAQYKRSAVPNGPKLLTGGALSPRGDWRAPSDAAATIWRQDLARNVPDHP
jgi:NAD+ synthase (glutamine-hydrolysing)